MNVIVNKNFTLKISALILRGGRVKYTVCQMVVRAIKKKTKDRAQGVPEYADGYGKGFPTFKVNKG